MAERITITDLTFRYSQSGPTVLSSVSLEVAAGSCCAVLGPTGSGKTTLLHCLAGTLRRHHPESVASGRLEIGEETFGGLPEHILFPVTGLVLQDPYVQISGVRETVFEELLFTLENLGVIPNDYRTRIQTVLKDLGIDHLAERKPTSLSGGETQRVAVAAILIARPSVLLLDEPTTALDSGAVEKLQDIMHSLHGTTTVVLTDTQIDFALAVADTIIVLDQGAVVFRGNPMSLLSHLQEFESLLPVRDWLRVWTSFGKFRKGSRHEDIVRRALRLK